MFFSGIKKQYPDNSLLGIEKLLYVNLYLHMFRYLVIYLTNNLCMY